MSNSLKKFGGLDRFDHEVLADAPAPTPVKSVQTPLWMDRYPVLHHDHFADLEAKAAMNEFGLKMPREAAEKAAHDDYVKRWRTQAAAHHLAGMKAAHAAGDMEAARKHSMMYNLHVKALGHEPVGPAHPDVVEAMKRVKAYRFKPHKGDIYAVNEATDSNGEELWKAEREALHTIWRACKVLSKTDVAAWAKAELAIRKRKRSGKPRPCRCKAYDYPHRAGGGKCKTGR
jgi:hypothetical protein